MLDPWPHLTAHQSPAVSRRPSGAAAVRGRSPLSDEDTAARTMPESLGQCLYPCRVSVSLPSVCIPAESSRASDSPKPSVVHDAASNRRESVPTQAAHR